jgi:hypothetical protein
MKRIRFTEEQIIGFLPVYEIALGHNETQQGFVCDENE